MTETKKINRLMAGIFLLHIVIVAMLTVAGGKIQIGVLLNLSLGEIILFVPTLVYLVVHKIKNGSQSLKERLHYNKVKPSTLLYVLFFTWLSMPLTTLINSVSMLFVDNTVMGMADIILDVPFFLMLFFMAVLPATVEELVFRGVTYGGYRRSGTKFMAVMLSALMFGLMHMNLNQALYAFVIGILLALLFEATNSIWATMLFHFIYNAQSCSLMFLIEAIMPGYYEDAANLAISPDQLYITIGVYMVIAVIATPLAFCMLYKIAKNEGREKDLRECIPGKQQGKEKLVTISYVVATVIALLYIALDIVISRLIL